MAAGTGVNTCYATYFADPHNDPLGEGPELITVLENVYHPWRTVAAPPSAPTLLATLVNLFEEQAVGGIAVFVVDASGEPRLRIIHGLRKYSGVVGRVSPLTNKVFGYLDDTDHGEAELVEVTVELLAQTVEINVCTVAHHKATLEGDVEIEVIPTRANADPQTETIKARKAAFVPFGLVPFVLSKNLTVRDAFLVLEPHLEAGGLIDVSAPLLDFLRVSGTKSTAATMLTALPSAGPAFHLETGLMRYMKTKVLHRDLPFYKAVAPRSDPATQALTAAVNTLANISLQRDEANERRRAEEDQPTTIAASLGETVAEKLLVLCNKSTFEELPILYTRLANKKKKEDNLTIVQEAVNRAATALNLTGAPVVTPATLAFVKTFRFYGIDKYDVASGVLPMSFVPPGAASAQARARGAEANQQTFGYLNMMSTENQHITSADAKELAKSKGYVATRWSEATVQLEAYQAVLCALLGSNHEVFRAYQMGVRQYKRIALQFQDALDRSVGEALAPALLVYSFQIRIRAWMEEQWMEPDTVPTPDFASELRTYQYTENLQWLPDVSLVQELRGLIRSPTPSPPHGQRFQSSPGPTPSGGSSAQRDNRQPARQTRVENAGIDPRFREDNELREHIKSWKISKAIGVMRAKGKPIPRRTDRECCIAYHAKGFCFTDCRLKQDHVSCTDTEKDDFFEWCKEAYA